MMTREEKKTLKEVRNARDMAIKAAEVWKTFAQTVKDRYHKIIIQLKTVNAIYEKETQN